MKRTLKNNSTWFKLIFGIGLTISVYFNPSKSLSQGVSGSDSSINYNPETQNDYPSDYWKRSDGPLLGQLIPVNQINLQKGVHLLDVEVMGKQWKGVTNPFDTMGLGSYDTNNQETLVRIRYAYPLARYTYIGVTAGFSNRYEAELYNESGMIDPEIFIGQHIPWRNGNVRLSLSASPSLGPAELNRKIGINDESAKGNMNRGGWSLRPEVSVTARINKVIIGGEANYLYLDDRTVNEKVSVSPDALMDPSVQAGLTHQYLGPNTSSLGYGSGISNYGLFSGTEEIQTIISGGSAWAVKGLIEIPDWYRLGAELIYGQVDTSTRKNDFGKVVQNDGGDFQEVRVYGRYKFNEKMSLTPLLSWMPSMPLTRGQQRLDSTSDVFGFQLTLRSKFDF